MDWPKRVATLGRISWNLIPYAHPNQETARNSLIARAASLVLLAFPAAASGLAPASLQETPEKRLTKEVINDEASSWCNSGQYSDDTDVVVKDRGKNRLADTEPMTTNGQPTHGTHGQRWRLTVYRQNIEHHVISRTKLKFSELDDDQAKAALRSTIRHEMMHRCKGDSGDADGVSCNHYFIDFSIATELCAQIAQIAAALEAVEDEEEQQKWLRYLQLLCNDYNYIKD